MAILIEPPQNELSALQSLSDSAGFLKKTGDGSYSIDTNSYLTANQSITISGDATGSGTTNIALTLASSGVVAGTYNNSATQVRPFTVDSKGRVTSVGIPVNITPAWSSISFKPTTLSGYGITDALSLSGGTVTGTTTFTNITILAGSLVTAWNITSHTDIDNLITGSTFGTLFEGIPNGHFTIGLRSNDMGDGFQILSKEANNASYTLKCFEVLANGNASVAGSFTAKNFIKADSSFFVENNQVVSARKIGWTAPTGTATRATFATSTVTISQLAERVKALIDDLMSHGLIGA